MSVYGEVTNSDRAEWAMAAMQAFDNRAIWTVAALEEFHGQTRFYPFDWDNDDEVKEAAGDLLCNLMHLIRLRGFDVDQMVRDAVEMHAMEVIEDLDGI